MSPEQAESVARSANNQLKNTLEHGNIRTQLAIENLFQNFDRIPIEDLENFAAAFNPDQDCKKTRIFTREEVEKVIEDMRENPDPFIDSVQNEYTDQDAQSLLEIFEPQK